ncbi:hypothetical protein D5086_028600 [Populus alba]|uniref:Uncharacterized protein n=1 Tax=Populus alba TaxID=43335 RepID=A0ACC4AR99_POPAL
MNCERCRTMALKVVADADGRVTPLSPHMLPQHNVGDHHHLSRLINGVKVDVLHISLWYGKTGVNSSALQGDERIVVRGDGTDAAHLTSCLRRKEESHCDKEDAPSVKVFDQSFTFTDHNLIGWGLNSNQSMPRSHGITTYHRLPYVSPKTVSEPSQPPRVLN